MKRYTSFFAILSVLIACSAHGAQQPITTITSGTGTSGKTLKAYNDNDINPRITKIHEMFTDIYTNAAFKSCFLTTGAWASCFPNLPLVGSDLSLSSIKTYIEDNATPVAPEEIGALFPGPADGYLLKNGTATSAPPSTESGPTFLTADPTSPANNSMWYNTTSHELKIATADGLWADGTFAAWSQVDAFQFTNLTDQTADGLLKCSAAITPTGANHSWPVTVSGDAGCSVKINGGTAAATGTWAPTQTVEACVNSSASALTTTSCTPSIGAVAATQSFNVSTSASEPSSGSILLGSDVVDTPSTVQNLFTDNIVYTTKTATWPESSTTTTISELCAYVKGGGAGNGNGKMALLQNDGTIIASTEVFVGPAFGVSAWRCGTILSPPTITKGTSYKLGLLIEVNYRFDALYNNTGSEAFVRDNTNSYSTPANVTTDATIDSSATVPFYGKK